ncbi:MAG: TraR/DksA C4-type zinc finger protein [Candidatus Marinimicrobia bacterium]|nr:TraR/DksA C4-type zinc finger protein [Candidatus Neomarinimicrobiota bacterium]MCH8011884.1 TraR/DksA C4-type zinc finger protein [Candidatus Neomarinimicrobiota bacterium]MCH8068180.1 TraR/DksA C4-type zinc finger protein [Candidatus Neomarinimicrobiota bacterium]
MTQNKLSKKMLSHYEKLIQEKRDRALEEMGYIREQSLNDQGNLDTTTRDSTYAYHMADVGTDAMEREKSFLWFTRENNFIRYLDEALLRIKNETFGFCIECDNKILNERLEEVPHTQHCVSCKNKANS